MKGLKTSDLKYFFFFLQLNSFPYVHILSSFFLLHFLDCVFLETEHRNYRNSESFKLQNGLQNETDNYGEEWFYPVKLKNRCECLPLLILGINEKPRSFFYNCQKAPHPIIACKKRIDLVAVLGKYTSNRHKCKTPSYYPYYIS